MDHQMYLITIKLFFKKLFLWLKEYWQIPFLIIWSIIIYTLTRRNSDAIIDVLNAKKESYEEQISELKKIHTNELLQRDGLLEDYKRSLKQVQEKFDESTREIEEREKQAIKEIIINSKGNPDAVKKQIENLFDISFTS